MKSTASIIQDESGHLHSRNSLDVHICEYEIHMSKNLHIYIHTCIYLYAMYADIAHIQTLYTIFFLLWQEYISEYIKYAVYS